MAVIYDKINVNLDRSRLDTKYEHSDCNIMIKNKPNYSKLSELISYMAMFRQNIQEYNITFRQYREPWIRKLSDDIHLKISIGGIEPGPCEGPFFFYCEIRNAAGINVAHPICIKFKPENEVSLESDIQILYDRGHLFNLLEVGRYFNRDKYMTDLTVRDFQTMSFKVIKDIPGYLSDLPKELQDLQTLNLLKNDVKRICVLTRKDVYSDKFVTYRKFISNLCTITHRMGTPVDFDDYDTKSNVPKIKIVTGNTTRTIRTVRYFDNDILVKIEEDGVLISIYGKDNYKVNDIFKTVTLKDYQKNIEYKINHMCKVHGVSYDVPKFFQNIVGIYDYFHEKYLRTSLINVKYCIDKIYISGNLDDVKLVFKQGDVSTLLYNNDGKIIKEDTSTKMLLYPTDHQLKMKDVCYLHKLSTYTNGEVSTVTYNNVYIDNLLKSCNKDFIYDKFYVTRSYDNYNKVVFEYDDGIKYLEVDKDKIKLQEITTSGSYIMTYSEPYAFSEVSGNINLKSGILPLKSCGIGSSIMTDEEFDIQIDKVKRTKIYKENPRDLHTYTVTHKGELIVELDPRYKSTGRYGYKAALTELGNKCIVKLELLPNSKVATDGYQDKLRVNIAMVVGIFEYDLSLKYTQMLTKAYSIHDNSFMYYIGDIVSVNNFNNDLRRVCVPGIHFFTTQEDAIRFHENMYISKSSIYNYDIALRYNCLHEETRRYTFDDDHGVEYEEKEVEYEVKEVKDEVEYEVKEIKDEVEYEVKEVKDEVEVEYEEIKEEYELKEVKEEYEETEVEYGVKEIKKKYRSKKKKRENAKIKIINTDKFKSPNLGGDRYEYDQEVKSTILKLRETVLTVIHHPDIELITHPDSVAYSNKSE